MGGLQIPTKSTIELSREHVNRIIIYSGSFNPPRVGHFITLELSLSTPNSWAVGAIVIPHFDNILRRKFEGRNNALVLLYATRAQMWREISLFGGEKQLPENAWVYEPQVNDTTDQSTAFCNFATTLKTLAANDDYAIEFVGLLGPNETMPQRGMVPRFGAGKILDTYLIINSDTGIFWCTYGLNGGTKPAKFDDYEDWKLVDDKQQELALYARSRAWECMTVGEAKPYIRFLDVPGLAGDLEIVRRLCGRRPRLAGTLMNWRGSCGTCRCMGCVEGGSDFGRLG